MIDLLVILLGLLAGRIFNEVIHHLPRRLRLFSQPAACAECGRSIPALWLPVGGYLVVKGRCPSCGHRLTTRLPAAELLTALLFWFAYRQAGLTGETLFAWAFIGVAIVVSFVDLEHRLILNKALVASVVIALPLSLLAGRPVTATLLGAGAAFALLLVISGFYPGAMGGGDVKFSFVLGVFLGWPNVLVGLLLGFIAGGLTGLLLLALRLRKLKDMIPFGPFLAAGGLAAFWWGTQIVNYYFNWSGLTGLLP